MSDIGILNSPLAIAFLLALFGGPGLAAGAVIGALLWRRHRVIGGLTAIIYEAIRALKSVSACSFVVAPAGQNRSLITLEA